MSVDKFGRFSERKREGIKLTSNGDYDLERKRIKFLKDPIDPEDAINLLTLKANCLPMTTTKLGVQNRRIINVGKPTSGSDAATKQFVENLIPLKNVQTKSYSVHQYNVKDVAYPKSDGDAVNLKYVKDKCLMYDKDIDAKNKIIINLQTPIKPDDAVNLKYVQEKCLMNDVEIDARGKTITNLQSPHKLSDAVNLDYMRANTMYKKINTFDGQKCTISNIASPINIDDVVSKRYLKEVFGDLGYTVYSKITPTTGRASLHDSADWKSKVLNFSWDDLFKL